MVLKYLETPILPYLLDPFKLEISMSSLVSLAMIIHSR